MVMWAILDVYKRQDLSRTAPDVSPLLPNDWNLITINYYQDAFYTDQSAYNVFVNGETVGNKFSTIPVSITIWSTLRLANKNFASGYVDSIKVSRAYGSLINFTPDTTMFAFDKDTIVINNFDSTSASASGEFNSQLVVLSSSTSTLSLIHIWLMRNSYISINWFLLCSVIPLAMSNNSSASYAVTYVSSLSPLLYNFMNPFISHK